MLEQELKDIWKNSAKAEQIKFEMSRLMIDMESKMKRVERAIRIRDLSEISASIVGIPLFTYFAYEVPFVWAKVGAVLSVVWFVYVIFKFRHSKKQGKAVNLASSFREQLIHHRAHLYHQAQLLNTVLYWYVLPPFIANLIFIAGIGNSETYHWQPLLIKLVPVTLAMKLTYIIGLSVFYAFTVWINKRAVKRNINPAIEELEQVIAQLDKEE